MKNLSAVLFIVLTTVLGGCATYNVSTTSTPEPTSRAPQQTPAQQQAAECAAPGEWVLTGGRWVCIAKPVVIERPVAVYPYYYPPLMYYYPAIRLDFRFGGGHHR